MDSKTRPLHVLFFPLMSQGHLIPMIDVAKLFALRAGVHVSIVTTPLNAAQIQSTIDRTTRFSGHHPITIHLLQFPSIEAGLPIGVENFDSFTREQTGIAFTKALPLLHHPFEQLVEQHCPDCIISDMFFPWTVDVAAKFNVPRLVFHGTSFFAVCVGDSIERYKPHEGVATETEPFLVPKLPHPIETTRSQLPDFLKTRTPFTEMMERVQESINQSYGVVMNSFYELEPDYVKHYREEVRGSIKAWHIGPVSLCNKDQIDMAERGKKAFIDPTQCTDWLGSREPGSVLYVCFGSLCQLSGAQLMEIAVALEASGRPFIWVVKNTDRMEEEWTPDGFEERMKGKGLIIREWAPQFFNEKLVTRVLGIGVDLGAHVWAESKEKEKKHVMGSEEIERAVAQLMGGGDEADERRRRARELGEMAKKAVEKGGSSCMDFDRLIEELKEVRTKA
ncbi:hypothetical protein MRB53_025358 [Persea americana]|uniref:Uncharacterized protein n=1 Tax=Persea americana TaxID=3435 RepID=A0ACC2LEX2_PERAE|nr:hypothetical protein MRB53_025358 [Persea americana]